MKKVRDNSCYLALFGLSGRSLFPSYVVSCGPTSWSGRGEVFAVQANIEEEKLEEFSANLNRLLPLLFA